MTREIGSSCQELKLESRNALSMATNEVSELDNWKIEVKTEDLFVCLELKGTLLRFGV